MLTDNPFQYFQVRAYFQVGNGRFEYWFNVKN